MSGPSDFKWRWPALAALIVVLVVLAPGVKKASVPDNALTVWFLETDPQLAAYNDFQQTFGNDEVILLGIHAPEGIFEPQLLGRVARLIGDIETVDGVARVYSIFNMKDARAAADGTIEFDLVFPEVFLESAEQLDEDVLEEAAARVLGNPLFRDRFVTADGTRTVLWVQMDVMDDIDLYRDAIVDEVRALAHEQLDDIEHALGGVGVIYSGLNKLTTHDFGLFISITYLLMFGALGFIFRSWRLVLAAVGVITAGTIAALGVYGLAGHRLNMVTVVVPTMIIVLATADAVHFPTAFFQAATDREASRSEVIRRTLRHVLAPCILTTVTTMAGFLALASAPMAVIRDLGIYSAIGIGTALVACVIFMVIAFHGEKARVEAPERGRSARFLAGVLGLLTRRPAALGAISVLVLVLAGIGWSRVKNDTYTLGYLPDDNEVVMDHEALESGWGAYAPLDFMVTPADGLRMDDPEILEGLERFVTSASELPEIRSGFSLHTVFRRMAQVFDVSEDEPMSTAGWAQLSDLLRSIRFEWDPEHPNYQENILAPLTSRDYTQGRVTLVGSMMSARNLALLLDQLSVVADEAFGDSAEVAASGYPPLYTRIIDYVMASQIRSFFLAVAIIFLLMLIALRSVRLALISLPPNLFPVAVMMGVMGALDIHLDVATATVAAIVIGVAVDDTVHFLYAWRKAERQGLDWHASVEHTFRIAGRAAIVTTILLLVGFPVLMLGQVRTVFYFGLLTSVAAVAALYADLIILPLLLRLFPSRRTVKQNGGS